MEGEKMDELKPCPACGSKAEIHPMAGTAFADQWVTCSAGNNCETARYRVTKEAAIEAWNNFYCWKELDRLREELNWIKNYSPTSASGCALCNYMDGVFISHCTYHKELEDLRAQCSEALNAWMLVESEMRDNNPCPDLLLRGEYRKKAILLTKEFLSKHEGK